MENLTDVIQWVKIGGAITIVSWFVSWLLDDFTWWQNIKTQYKKLLILGVAIVIGIGAQYLDLHQEALEVIRPYLDSSVMILVAWIATQVAHKADK